MTSEIIVKDYGDMIAKLKDTLWTAIYTYRKKKIRIISVRKARKYEEEIYYHG